MKILLVIVVVMSMAVLVGCGGKKVRPLEEEQVGEPGAKTPGEAVEPGAGEEPVKPIRPERPEELDLKPVHFDYDRYNLTDKATTILAENAALLMANPSVHILIEGHCDERGTDEYNLALGEKRALAARDYFVSFGIARSRLSVISYGEERPIDPAANEEAWAKNRRGDFVIK